jgi:predicted unusual protein kinase regulating ubiquinone biosynthesis (AarF/ABC1/UbiB family)
MVGRLTPDLKAHLRDGFIGVALRDPHRLVQSMQGAGWLLPSADVDEIERAVAKVFAKYWGISMGELQTLDLHEAGKLVAEFRQLLYRMPFQIPANVLFLARALGILSGLATTIDPQFNVFDSAEPFARTMLVEEGQSTLDAFVSQLTEIGAAVIRLPTQMDRLISAALRGEVRVNMAGGDALAREVRALNASLRRLISTLIFTALLLAGILLQVNGYSQVSGWVIGAAILVLAWSVLRR